MLELSFVFWVTIQPSNRNIFCTILSHLLPPLSLTSLYNVVFARHQASPLCPKKNTPKTFFELSFRFHFLPRYRLTSASQRGSKSSKSFPKAGRLLVDPQCSRVNINRLILSAQITSNGFTSSFQLHQLIKGFLGTLKGISELKQLQPNPKLPQQFCNIYVLILKPADVYSR